MLRFSDGSSQELFKRTRTSDHLPVARPTKLDVDHMRVVDTDVGKASGVSSAHTAVEDAYHTLHNSS